MPWTSPDTLTRWIERTTWWARPTALTSSSEMLVELVEAVAGRFLGRELTMEVGGRKVTLTLGQVRVERSAGGQPSAWWDDLPGSREMRRWTRLVTRAPSNQGADLERVHVESSHVLLDGGAIGDVAADIDGVRLDYGNPAMLVTGPVDLEVRTAGATIVEWVERALPEWTVQRRDADLFAVRHRDWRFTVLARPDTVAGRSLHLDIVGVVVLGRDVKFPRRMVRSRTIELPPLGDELELIGARVDGDAIFVTLRHAGVRQPVRPEHLRAAIREGAAYLGAKVFA